MKNLKVNSPKWWNIVNQIDHLSSKMDKACPTTPGPHFYDMAEYDRLKIEQDKLMAELSKFS